MTDKTKYASEMNLELSTLPPFTKVSTLIIDGEEILAKDVNKNNLGISYYLINTSEYVEFPTFSGSNFCHELNNSRRSNENIG